MVSVIDPCGHILGFLDWSLCGLVVSVPGYRSRGSISDDTRFSEK
jgi:hypothetical protein